MHDVKFSQLIESNSMEESVEIDCLQSNQYTSDNKYSSDDHSASQTRAEQLVFIFVFIE